MFIRLKRKHYTLRPKPAHRHHTFSLVGASVVLCAMLIFSQTIWGTGQLFSPGVEPEVGEISSTHVKKKSGRSSGTPQISQGSAGAILTLKGIGHSYGIAAGSRLAGLSSNQLNAELDDMVKMGLTWVRFDIEWSQIQPDSASQYQWDDYDRVVKAARARKLNVLAIIDYTPAWARPQGCDSAQCAPRDANEYAKFAATAVKRYRSFGVRAWEVWNEPNSAQFWAPAANPAAYTRLLKATYPSIKKADPGAIVLTGGLAPQPTDGTNIGRREFLKRMYAQGAKGYFDGVSDHPYTFPRLPADNTDRAWSEMSTTTDSLRRTMVANGDRAKKIWITEYGAPTGGPGPAATPANSETVVDTWHVNEALQADILRKAIKLYRSYDWVGPFFWYSYKDAGTTPDTNENFFGLVRADGSHKPAYDAYVTAIR